MFDVKGLAIRPLDDYNTPELVRKEEEKLKQKEQEKFDAAMRKFFFGEEASK